MRTQATLLPRLLPRAYQSPGTSPKKSMEERFLLSDYPYSNKKLKVVSIPYFLVSFTHGARRQCWNWAHREYSLQGLYHLLSCSRYPLPMTKLETALLEWHLGVENSRRSKINVPLQSPATIGVLGFSTHYNLTSDFVWSAGFLLPKHLLPRVEDSLDHLQKSVFVRLSTRQRRISLNQSAPTLPINQTQVK